MNTVDESGCVAFTTNTSNYTGCPPIANGACVTGTNENCDPNCGVATLDEMQAGATGYSAPCNGNALATIVHVYSLGAQYNTDPWGRAYIWGCDYVTFSSAACQAAPPSGSGTPVNITNSDRRYHKFYSQGPDSAFSDDDIVP